jgi:hypothetical protein
VNVKSVPSVHVPVATAGQRTGSAGVAVHIDVPEAPVLSVPAASSHWIAAACVLAEVALNEAALALSLALLRLTITIAAKIPMIAITTKSSTRVNPFLFVFIFSPPF